jgi:hypothetical protein
MREQLEAWEEQFPDLFTCVFCVGSRWTNVHWGAAARDKEQYAPPPLPEGYATLKHKEMVCMWYVICGMGAHGCMMAPSYVTMHMHHACRPVLCLSVISVATPALFRSSCLRAALYSLHIHIHNTHLANALHRAG